MPHLGVPKQPRDKSIAPFPLILVIMSDVVVTLIATLVAHKLRFSLPGWSDPQDSFTFWMGAYVAFFWLLALGLSGTYSLNNLHSGVKEYDFIILTSALFAGNLAILGYLFEHPIPRSFLVIFFLTGVPGLLVIRFARRRIVSTLRARGLLQLPVLVAGKTTNIDEVAHALKREKWLGYDIIGAVTDDRVTSTGEDIPVIGFLDEVVDLARIHDVHAVIFTEGSFESAVDFKHMAWEMEDQGANMIVVPALTDISAERVSMAPVAGMPLVHVSRPQAIGASRLGKRLFDIIGSIVFLVLTAPVIALVALAIKLEDGGPVFFRQARVGRFHEEFDCFKVRSMVVDAEARKKELAAQNEGAGVLFKMAKDPRITKVGRFIRRFSIDELPQFWNVLRGDMSLVGPRPALPSEVAQYDSHVSRRLDVRPGLTGLWQVSGRSDLAWEEAVRLDTYYVDNWSFLQDVVILLRTVKAVLGSDGAY